MAAATISNQLPEATAENVGATSKGYQQVTAWQVGTAATTPCCACFRAEPDQSGCMYKHATNCPSES